MSLIVYTNHFRTRIKDYFWQARLSIAPPAQCYVSRCNYNPNIFDTTLVCESVDELKQLKYQGHTWADCMNQKAIELKNIDEKLYVLYSGGVDSVGIICSILKNFNKEELKKVIILCTPTSVIEFPEFFNLIVDKFTVQYADIFLEKYTYDGFIVSGMLGDLFFSEPNFTKKAFDMDIASLNYKDGMVKLYSSYSKEFGKKYFDLMCPIVDESMYEINDTLDFLSWMYFTQLYQKVKLGHITQKNNFINLSRYKKIINFFDTEYFQLWGLYNQKNNKYKSMNDYKKEPKKYIYEIFDNMNYFNNKQKYPSYLSMIFGTEWIDAIDDQWNIITLNEAMEHINVGPNT